MAVTIIPLPARRSRSAAARHTGGSFLAWQLFRRPNHASCFYPTVVPVAIGLAVAASPPPVS